MNSTQLLFSFAELGQYLRQNLHILFFILAGICLVGFFITFMIYLNMNKNKDNPQPKTWTIESAKRYLESNNISVKENENIVDENANANAKIATKQPAKVNPIKNLENKNTTKTNISQSAKPKIAPKLSKSTNLNNETKTQPQKTVENFTESFEIVENTENKAE